MATDLLTGLLGFLFTVMVLSYLVGDNLFFRVAVHVFVGLAAGYVASVVWNQVIVSKMLLPLLSGTPVDQILLIPPLILSLMLLLRVFRRLEGVSRPVVAFLVGVGAAVAVSGSVLGTLIPQTQASINLFDMRVLADSPFFIEKVIESVLIVVGTVASLAYFQFGVSSKERETGQRGLVMRGIAFVGQVFIAITLGVLFAGIFSAALAALVDRIQSILAFIMSLF